MKRAYTVDAPLGSETIAALTEKANEIESKFDTMCFVAFVLPWGHVLVSFERREGNRFEFAQATRIVC